MPIIKTAGLSRRLYTALAVLAVLAAIVCAYYYYVSTKEQKLQTRNFRVLHRIEANFKRRIDDHRQLILSKLRVCAPCRDRNANQKNWQQIARDTINNDGQFQYEFDSLGKARNSQVIGNGNDSRIYFYVSSKDFAKTGNKEFYVKVSTEAKNILEGVLRYDVFPSFILAGSGGIAYNNCPEICEIGKRDTLPLNDNLTELKIGSGKFFVFNHPFSLGDQQVILSGIIPEEKYGEQKHSIPTGFLLTVFLVMLIILLAFPFIKSFLVSPEETFDVGDVLSALLSLFLLCYMFVFICLNVFTVNREVIRREKILQATNAEIRRSFRTELYQMRRQLEYYDAVFNKHYDTIQKSMTGRVDTSLEPKYYRSFYRAYWLDEEGIQITDLGLNAGTFSRQANSSERDYHDRGYFKAVTHNALWYPDSPDLKKIYVEPVYSRIDGSFRAVMTKKSIRKPVVAALASEMKSVINAVLPQEVDFCLVNSKGDILFTSAGNEHINENLLEECNSDKKLSAALYSRASTSLDVSFLGSEHSFYISPVEGLPLYVATFRNDTLYGGTQLNICIYTSILILITLLLFSLAILSMMSLAKKNEIKLIREPAVDLSILLPARKHFYRDFGAIINNVGLMIAVALVAYVCRNEPFTLIFLFLVNAAGTTAAFCYARLNLDKRKQRVFWFVMAFLFLACDVMLLELRAWENKYAFICFVLYQILLVIVIWRLSKVKDFDRKTVRSADDSEEQEWSDTLWKKVVYIGSEFVYRQFAIMLVTWFMLVALVPTIFIYRYFYINEREYRLKSAQVDIARKWFDHGRYNVGQQKPATGQPVTYLRPYYQTVLWPREGFVCDSTPGTQQVTFNSMLDRFRSILVHRNIYQNAVDTANVDASLRFCKAGKKLSLSYVNLMNQPESRGTNTLLVKSTLPDFRMPLMRGVPFLVSVTYFIIVVLFLIVFYNVIKFFLKRFFLFEIYSKIGHKTDDRLVEFISNHLKHADGYPEALRLVILGVTNSGKMDIVDEAIKKAGVEARVIKGDFSEMNKLNELPTDYTAKDMLILKHFEHNLGDAATNKEKFDLISRIFQMDASQRPHLIISSNIHPSIFLNSLKANHLKTKPDEVGKADSFRAEDYIEMEQYYNWTGLMSGFTVHVKRFKKPEGEQRELADNQIYDASKSKYIFYLSIWNSLERIEKFVLYDLALDNLVNYRNKAILYNLYNKGLVVLEDDVLQIMNMEFRAFILNEISEEDVALIKKQSGSRSAWDMFRLPFFMILIGALLFVFVTQQETFNKLMAGIAAFAGAIPILIKLLSFNQEKKPA